MRTIGQFLQHQLCPLPPVPKALGIQDHFVEAFHLILVEYAGYILWVRILLAFVLVGARYDFCNRSRIKSFNIAANIL